MLITAHNIKSICRTCLNETVEKMYSIYDELDYIVGRGECMKVVIKKLLVEVSRNNVSLV